MEIVASSFSHKKKKKKKATIKFWFPTNKCIITKALDK